MNKSVGEERSIIIVVSKNVPEIFGECRLCCQCQEFRRLHNCRRKSDKIARRCQLHLVNERGQEFSNFFKVREFLKVFVQISQNIAEKQNNKIRRKSNIFMNKVLGKKKRKKAIYRNFLQKCKKKNFNFHLLCVALRMNTL